MNDDNSIEAFLQTYSADVQGLARQTRDLVKLLLPTAREHLAAGYNTLTYGTGAGMAEQVVYIALFKKHVNLGFYAGTALPDPEGLLEGTGKMLRHVKIKKASDLEKLGVRPLIEAAWKEAV
jgi:hypothetical protein